MNLEEPIITGQLKELWEAECRRVHVDPQSRVGKVLLNEVWGHLNRNKIEVHRRLSIGDGQRCVFLPFIGEVGWLIMWHVRMVHFSKATYKIVCCKRGQECLFPSANEFDYDWIDPIDDSTRGGTDRVPREWPEILNRHPQYCPVPAGNLTMDQELIAAFPHLRVPIQPTIRRGLKSDICIGVRERKFLPAKNYQGWTWIASQIKSMGLSFSIIGSRESSYPIPGMQHMSGDYDWSAGVELLQNCSLFIGTDSGGAHLASLVGECAMVVQEVPHPASDTTRNFIGRMKMTTPYPVTELPAEDWSHPEAFVNLIDIFFSDKESHGDLSLAARRRQVAQ